MPMRMNDLSATKSSFKSLMHPSLSLVSIVSGLHVPWMPTPLKLGTLSLKNQGPYAPFLIPFPSLKSCFHLEDFSMETILKVPSGVFMSPLLVLSP